MPTTILDTEFALMTHDAGSKMLYHEIRRPLRPGELRTLLSAGLDVVKRGQATRWLSNDLGNGVLPTADAQWAQTQFSPEAVQAGWKFWAIIQPEGAIGKLQMKRFIQDNADIGLTVEIFADQHAAKEWLKAA
tara:strand:+ start:180 stop:578 length:399 start_codon:yes stop_codon:yes gene_type:complete